MEGSEVDFTPGALEIIAERARRWAEEDAAEGR